jgi:hypothetical protein
MAEKELQKATFLPRRQSRYLGPRALGRRLSALPFRWSLPFSEVILFIGIFADILTLVRYARLLGPPPGFIGPELFPGRIASTPGVAKNPGMKDSI